MGTASVSVGFARLVALHEDVQPTEYVLENHNCTIGRSTDCHIVVNRRTVSRLHARIERKGYHCILHDLSRNQTFVNDIPLDAPHMLRDRDAIGLALPEPLLFFQDSDPTVEPQTSRLYYDARKRRFLLDHQPLYLTPQQHDLLHHLYENAGRVCTYEACARAVYGDDCEVELLSQGLNNTVYRLRQRLALVDPDCDLIEARRGIGLMLIG